MGNIAKKILCSMLGICLAIGMCPAPAVAKTAVSVQEQIDGMVSGETTLTRFPGQAQTNITVILFAGFRITFQTGTLLKEDIKRNPVVVRVTGGSDDVGNYSVAWKRVPLVDNGEGKLVPSLPEEQWETLEPATGDAGPTLLDTGEVEFTHLLAGDDGLTSDSVWGYYAQVTDVGTEDGVLVSSTPTVVRPGESNYWTGPLYSYPIGQQEESPWDDSGQWVWSVSGGNAVDGYSVTGAVHKEADLVSTALGATQPTYRMLEDAAAADGKKLDGAWNVALVNVPSGKGAYIDEILVRLDVTGLLDDYGQLPEGTEIYWVGPKDGTRAVPLSPSPQVVYEKDGRKSLCFTISEPADSIASGELGAFAIATKASNIYTVKSHVAASGGGQIDPAGESRKAEGAKPAYVLVPDPGYVVDRVTVTREGQEPHIVSWAGSAGNTFTLSDGVFANTDVEVAFAPAPVSTKSSYDVTVHSGMNGAVDVQYKTSYGAARASVEAGNTEVVSASANSALLFSLAPDSGFSVDKVMVGFAGQAPVEAAPIGGSYRISALTGDMSVTVTFRESLPEPDNLTHSVESIVIGEGGDAGFAGEQPNALSHEVTVDHGATASFLIKPASGKMLASAQVMYLRDDDCDGEVEEVVGPNIARMTVANTLSLNMVLCDTKVLFTFEDAPGASEDELVSVRLAGAVDTEGNTVNCTVTPSMDSHSGSSFVAGTTQTFVFTPTDSGHEGWVIDHLIVNGQRVDPDPAGSCYVDLLLDRDMEVSVVFRERQEGDPEPPGELLDITVEINASVTSTGGGRVFPEDGTFKVIEGKPQEIHFVPDATRVEESHYWVLDEVTIDGHSLLPFEQDEALTYDASSGKYTLKHDGGVADETFTFDPESRTLRFDFLEANHSLSVSFARAVDIAIKVSTDHGKAMTASNSYVWKIDKEQGESAPKVVIVADDGYYVSGLRVNGDDAFDELVAVGDAELAAIESRNGLADDAGILPALAGVFGLPEAYAAGDLRLTSAALLLSDKYLPTGGSKQVEVEASFAAFGNVNPEPGSEPGLVTPETDKFTITAEVAGGHGSIRTGVELRDSATFEVEEGGSATLTFVPDAGYRVAEVVDNGDPKDCAGTTDTKYYTLSNVDEDHRIVVTFANAEYAGSPMNRIIRRIRVLMHTGDANGPILVGLLLTAGAALVVVGMSLRGQDRARRTTQPSSKSLGRNEYGAHGVRSARCIVVKSKAPRDRCDENDRS